MALRVLGERPAAPDPVVTDAPPRRWWPKYVPLLVLMLCGAAILRPFMVENNDMAPGLQQGDLGLVIPRPLELFGPLSRGDVVVLPPGDIRAAQIRRIIALPGEVVEIAAGKILVDGRPLSGDFVATAYYPVDGKARRFRRRIESAWQSGGAQVQYQVAEQEAWVQPDRPGVVLGPDQYYVLSDRRTGARDSRDYGPMAGSTLRRVWAVSFAPGYGLLFGGH